MILEVPHNLIDATWPLLEPHLARAVAHEPYPHTDGLLEGAKAQRITLLAVAENERIVVAAALEVLKFPRKMIGNVLALGGDVGSLERYEKDVLDYLESWCVKRNLDTLCMLGRAGWGKVLPRHGWRVQPLTQAWKPLHGPVP